MLQIALWITGGVVAVVVATLVLRTYLIISRYGAPIRRIFEEDPIFVPSEGSPHPESEEVEFPTPEGLVLRGSYLATPAGPAKAVVVFSHEFRSDRWSGMPYWECLLGDGFDIFAFDYRNHGSSDKDPAYTPRHWVTNYELDDLEAAIAYLRSRPEADRLPIGLFGISRGGGASIGVAARDRGLRCVVTDGAFGTHGTMLTYMKKWMFLVVGDKWWLKILPDWYLGFIRDWVLARVERDFGCRFIRLERAIGRLAPRAVLMIHGGRDGYIRPDIAREFFAAARDPRELWIVHGARHNACLEAAAVEYRSRLINFFRTNLAGEKKSNG